IVATGKCTCNHISRKPIYDSMGRIAGNIVPQLRDYRKMIHECNTSCECNIRDLNRVSQTGTMPPLMLIKTAFGWQAKSDGAIRAGTFIGNSSILSRFVTDSEHPNCVVIDVQICGETRSRPSFYALQS